MIHPDYAKALLSFLFGLNKTPEGKTLSEEQKAIEKGTSTYSGFFKKLPTKFNAKISFAAV